MRTRGRRVRRHGMLCQNGCGKAHGDMGTVGEKIPAIHAVTESIHASKLQAHA